MRIEKKIKEKKKENNGRNGGQRKIKVERERKTTKGMNERKKRGMKEAP